jgi:7-carboxy-7-deazaguanine synthase
MKIHSIFQSINGEVCNQHQGSICTFVRLQGCNLQCPYCDTADSQDVHHGKPMTVEDVFEEILNLPVKTKNVTITGGEPLLQFHQVEKLINKLRKQKFKISVETNGTYKPNKSVVDKVSWVVDYKNPLPSRIDFFSNISNLKPKDWIKFIVQRDEDFYRALKMRHLMQKGNIKAHMAWSPVLPMTAQQLMSLLFLENIGDAVLNIQLHKLVSVP